MDLSVFDLSPLALLGFPTTAWVASLPKVQPRDVVVGLPMVRARVGNIEALRRHRTPEQGARRQLRARQKRERRAERNLRIAA